MRCHHGSSRAVVFLLASFDVQHMKTTSTLINVRGPMNPSSIPLRTPLCYISYFIEKEIA